MNTFKRKSLYAALAGLSALGAGGVANAVTVNPDGLGQVLIYPYYTVRSDSAGNAYSTLISVVNSTASGKAVKVRFLEGKNSREVLDFNLYLSPYDVWTAAVLPTSTGAGVITLDKSCTTPKVSTSLAEIEAGGASASAFVNYQYTGSNDDKADPSLDRTREGYIEIIQMGEIREYGNVTFPNLYAATKHSNGVPTCDPAGLSDAVADRDTLGTARGGLFGTGTLINVASGTDFSYDPVALDGFVCSDPEDFGCSSLWNVPGSPRPDLTDADPVSIVVESSVGPFIGFGINVSYWDAGSNTNVDAVSAVLMHDNLLNEFVLDGVTKSGSDWVVTMPTKKHYIEVGSGNAKASLFQRNFNGNNGSCDDIVLTRFDREEREVKTGITFSPPPPTPTDSICWEANVITWNGTNVLASKNIANIPTTFENGWGRINFYPSTNAVQSSGKHMLVSTFSDDTYFGLPTIGFAVHSYANGTLDNGAGPILSNYGGLFQHKQTRYIVD